MMYTNEGPIEIEPGKYINPAASINDTGDRTKFESGAVRDMHVGKGRFDLMPMNVLAVIIKCYLDCYNLRTSNITKPTYQHFSEQEKNKYGTSEFEPDLNQRVDVLNRIYKFECCGDVYQLYHAFCAFIEFNCYDISLGSSERDLYFAILDLAKHFEAGAMKYGENNWQKGIPVNSYIDSALRHYFKFLDGYTDERHDIAFLWNIMCCIWTCIHKPELNIYRREGDENE